MLLYDDGGAAERASGESGYRYTHRPTTWVAISADGTRLLAESERGQQWRLFMKHLRGVEGAEDAILTHREDAEQRFPDAMRGTRRVR